MYLVPLEDDNFKPPLLTLHVPAFTVVPLIVTPLIVVAVIVTPLIVVPLIVTPLIVVAVTVVATKVAIGTGMFWFVLPLLMTLTAIDDREDVRLPLSNVTVNAELVEKLALIT
jgi:hypothetical protein